MRLVKFVGWDGGDTYVNPKLVATVWRTPTKQPNGTVLYVAGTAAPDEDASVWLREPTKRVVAKLRWRWRCWL